MDSILKFLILTSPFGYISKNKRRVLNDFFACEELEESYAYQYCNASYYKELVLLICLMTSYKNLSDGKKINLEELDIGTKLLFKKEYYTFKGKDEISSDHYVLEPINQKKDSYTRILRKKVIEDGASIVTSTKKKKLNSVKEYFGKLLGLSSISWTNDQSVIIILEKKILNEIMEVQFNINGQVAYLGEFCAVRYLKESLNFEQLPHSNSTEKPIVIFSSNMDAVVEYLDEHNGEVPEKKVYVIGDKWFTEGQLINLNTLEDACDEFNILMAVFSSISSVMDKKKIDFLKKMEENFCWLDSEEFEKLEISFTFVSSNMDFNNALTQLNEYLEEISEVPELRYLDKLLKKFLKMNYSQLVGSSNTLEQQMIIISEYMEKLNLEETELVAGNLYDIYSNRFGYQNRKMMKSIKSKGKCAIIVMDEMVEETKEIYKNDTTITVLPYSAPIYEDLYGKFDTMILLSPYAKDRRKWLLSYISEKIVVVLPELQKKYLAYSLRKDMELIRSLYKLDTSRFGQDSGYLEVIDEYLDKNKKESKILQYSNYEEELFEKLDKEDDVQNTYARLLSSLEYSDFKAENEVDNQLVNVVFGIELYSGSNLFGTEFGKVFLLQENYCKRTNVCDLKPGQQILEFDIPYSDDFYRQRFKKYKNENLNGIETSQDIREDYFWKSILIKYIEKRKITPMQFKEKMDELGAVDKTTSFYKTWSSPDLIPILPQDSSFIYYIGLLTGNSKLINEPSKYYNASKRVKQNLNYERDRFIEAMDGKNLDDIIMDDSVKSHSTDKIVLVEDVDIKDVPRYLTNKILGGLG